MSYRLERFHEQDASVRVERKPTGAIIADVIIALGVLYILAHWVIKWVG